MFLIVNLPEQNSGIERQSVGESEFRGIVRGSKSWGGENGE